MRRRGGVKLLLVLMYRVARAPRGGLFFPLKADFWTAGAGAGGCFASISLGPRPLLPLSRCDSTLKSGPAVITGAHATKTIITPFKAALSPHMSTDHPLLRLLLLLLLVHIPGEDT